MGKLKVGASKALINIPKELFPFPHFGEFSFEGQLVDLYVRAIVLDNEDMRFIFFAADCGEDPETELKQEIAEYFQVPYDCVFGYNIHNHSAPGWDGHGMMGVDEQEVRRKGLAYRKVVVSGIYQAIREAIAGLRPARYGFAQGDSYINVNRDFQGEDGNWFQSQNFRGFSDKTLAVFKFEDYDGNLIAALLNYGCHATTAFCVRDTDGKEKATPGFPGICCSFIEERFGNGAICMWSSGAAGDQNPIFCSEGVPRVTETDGYSEAVATPPGTQYMIQRYHGQTHALDAIHILDSMTCTSDHMRIEIADTMVEIEAQKFPEGTDRFMNYLMANNAFKQFRPDLIVNGRPPKRQQVEMLPDGTMNMELKLYLFGTVAMIGCGGEIYSEIGWKMKEASPFKNTFIVTHCGLEGGGYTLSDASKDHNVFQSYGRVHPGDIDNRAVKGVKELFEQVL